MIINNAPQNEAIISNVSEIGEFRIRNSAKAFNILSSGLYANKIRAIIRELSCNAVDSHVAAGKADTPFDVHMPNQLEPWFAIRDYGTGLTHDQVTNIYTTYFESTKTNSNEFIGALGLGSKSPFSYTDNFTVTAIKDGVKGVYSAFINEAGVPSIAKMASETTDEPAGVEVKFSVNDRWDFDKFRQEARVVYKWFKLQPVVTGSAEFTIDKITYEEENIVPGIHSTNDQRRSTAIMGNIAYPIEIPDADKSLGDLRQLLNCGLIIEFAIGELDFQASREGLSYIPQTIASIKAKLESVNAVLADRIATQANAIPNMWERALFLAKKRDTTLWTAAVAKYVKDNKFPLIKDDGYSRVIHPKMLVEKLAKKYNIVVRGFEKSRGTAACTNLKSNTEFSDTKGPDGHYATWSVWEFALTNHTHFVFNDTKIGALERAKHHWRELQKDGTSPSRAVVYVVEPLDRTKPMKRDAFLKAIYNPPKDRICVASSLIEKVRATGGVMAKNVTILRLEEKGYGGYYTQKEMVWRDAGKADKFDANQTYYYMPLSGFQCVSAYGYGSSAKALRTDINDSGLKFGIGDIYGVRKGDIEFIKTQKNWINVEEYIVERLAKVTTDELVNLAVNAVDSNFVSQYNHVKVDAKSPFAKLTSKYKGERVRFNNHNLKSLYKHFAQNVNFDFDALVEQVKQEIRSIESRYPLLTTMSGRADTQAVAEYIELIDAKKGI